MNFRLASAVLLTVSLGCAHGSLQASDLDTVHHPALVARLTDDAGPQISVYRGDSSRAAALKGGSAVEADQKLEQKLSGTFSRFEVAERLRSRVQASLQPQKPWSQAVPPAQVAGVLETFLVQEVPSTPPDYARLKPLGADAVVEFLIEGFGLRSEKGVAETWVRGTGRMFRLSDGGELWRSPFSRTSTEARLPPLEPAGLIDDSQPYREQLVALLDAAALVVAQQLSPGGTVPAELQSPGDRRTPSEQETDRSRKQPPPPPPDATAPTESPVDPGGKKKAPRPNAPPPDATAPTQAPVDPNKR